MLKRAFKKIQRITQRLCRTWFRDDSIPTAIILTYHRVAEPVDDPHLLAVSPVNFEQQVEFLKKNYNVISLEQLIHDVAQQKLQQNSVVITFDDGYADNLYTALPILEKYNAPMTLFVTSGHIDTPRFYWDNVESDALNRPMTSSELLQIAQHPLITIGGHTLSHPHVPTLTTEQKRNEIIKDRATLQQMCSKPILTFSFPFGEYDEEAIAITQQAGFIGTCLLDERRITNNTAVHRLTRFLVRDWDAAQLAKKMTRTFI
jgi:peptidoglycan/xylan/chitin deacetylase (PgdA/CDA1 family)